jgi:hypothetical protein
VRSQNWKGKLSLRTAWNRLKQLEIHTLIISGDTIVNDS